MEFPHCVVRQRILCRSWCLARDNFTQFQRTLVAANLDDARADFDLDGTLVEFAIAGRTGFFNHCSASISLPCFGSAQETISRRRPLSKSLAIFYERSADCLNAV